MKSPCIGEVRGEASSSPPQLPAHIQQWSARSLASWLGVSTSTVKYHARQAFRDHNGRWELSCEQAQRIVDRIACFGHAGTLSHLNHVAPAPSSSTASGTAQSSSTFAGAAFRGAACAPARPRPASAPAHRAPAAPQPPPYPKEKNYDAD